MRGEDGTAEVLLCSSSRQFQRTPPLFRNSGFRRHIGAERGPAQSFFLLGFNKLGIKSSRHNAIVLMPGSVIPDPWSDPESRFRGSRPWLRAWFWRRLSPKRRRREAGPELIISNTCLFR